MGRLSNISWPIFKLGLGLSTSLLLVTSCSGLGSGSSGGTPLTVSGNLSLANSSQGLSVQKLSSQKVVNADSISALSIDLSQYSVTCATATTPILYGTGSVGSDGSFSVSIVGGGGQPMSCYLVDSNGNRAADFIISDSSNKDLNGQNQVTGTAVYKKSADMGSITFDPNSGEVIIPSSNVAGSLDTQELGSITLFDPSGP